MEVSALKYSGGIGLHGRSALLRLQSDERLVTFIRRGNTAAFEALVGRYESRLLAFCRHLLGSREDAEDVLQEVLAAAFNAMLADDRPINLRPWLYRIARNRSLNHLRRIQAVAVDSMDIHLSDNGASTADKAHDREEFRLLVGDIQELPETQKTALVLREMDALSYEQIAEAMETTVPSVKSLLVRARVSLAEAAEARLLSCEEVRIELGEAAEGLRRRPSPLVRRHLRACKRCTTFRVQLKETNKALTALLPIGPLVILKKFAIAHLGHGSSSATAAGSGAGAAGSSAAVGSTVVAGSSAGGFVSAGIGAIATKAAAGLAAAAIVTAGAVEVDHAARGHASHHPALGAGAPIPPPSAPQTGGVQPAPVHWFLLRSRKPTRKKTLLVAARKKAPSSKTVFVAAVASAKPLPQLSGTAVHLRKPAKPQGRTQAQSDPTVLTPPVETVSSTTTPSPASPTTASATPPPTTTSPPPPTTTQPPPPPPPPAGGGGSGGGSTGGAGAGAGAGAGGGPAPGTGLGASAGARSSSTGSATGAP